MASEPVEGRYRVNVRRRRGGGFVGIVGEPVRQPSGAEVWVACHVTRLYIGPGCKRQAEHAARAWIAAQEGAGR